MVVQQGTNISVPALIRHRLEDFYYSSQSLSLSMNVGYVKFAIFLWDVSFTEAVFALPILQ